MRIQPVSDTQNQLQLAARTLPGKTKTSNETDPQSNPLPQTQDNQNPSEKQVNDAVDVANQFMKEVDLSFKYYRDEATHTDVIQVVDDSTGDVIKQFPPQDILKMVAKMYEMWGIFVDKKV